MQQDYDFGATLQFGTVSAVDDTRHAVRVKLPALEDMETDWLPVLTLGAGGNRFYALPDVGGLAVCLLDARGEGGVCLGVVYNDADPAPESDRNIWCKRFANGTVIRHDRSSGQLTVDTPGDVLVKAARQVKIQTPTTEITGDTNILGHLTYSAGMSASNAGGVAASISGTADVRGDSLLNGVSLQKFVESHTHPGDSGGQTGTPQL